MSFSDEQIKDMLEIKERTLQKIEKYQKEIVYLEKQIEVLDVILKQSSFTKASSMSKPEQNSARDDMIPIIGSQGQVIANAHVTSEQVSVILDESLDVDANTAPFKTFFLDRIIGGMKKKDNMDVDRGDIQKESVIDCIINKNGSCIKEILVINYRQKERVNEIINTVGWSLNKMLENTK